MKYFLIYVSYASWDLSEEELKKLLSTANAYNSQQNITGMLIYLNGRFIQILEGDKDKVLTLYQRIKRDPKHSKITTLLEGEQPERYFENWSMGFKIINGQELKSMVGFMSIDEFLTKPQGLNLAHAFLKMFYDKNYKSSPG